ncbi:hypothetical protein EV401DRAFT_2199404 [Pisolithus croceorrhizus]|nr:hypothetical protein EV401DRAFT_2199404 [Pisolithus croceorrhizus]
MVSIEMKRYSRIKIGWKRVKGNEIVQWGITEDGMSKEEGNLKTRGRVRRVRAVATVCLLAREDSMAEGEGEGDGVSGVNGVRGSGSGDDGAHGPSGGDEGTGVIVTSVDIGGTEGADTSLVLVSADALEGKELALSVGFDTDDWSAKLPQREGPEQGMDAGSSSVNDIEMEGLVSSIKSTEHSGVSGEGDGDDGRLEGWGQRRRGRATYLRSFLPRGSDSSRDGMGDVFLAFLFGSATMGNREAVEVESEALSLESTEGARGEFVLWVGRRGVWVGFWVGDGDGDTRAVVAMGFEVVRWAEWGGGRAVSRVRMCEPGGATGRTGKRDCSSSHGGRTLRKPGRIGSIGATARQREA